MNLDLNGGFEPMDLDFTSVDNINNDDNINNITSLQNGVINSNEFPKDKLLYENNVVFRILKTDIPDIYNLYFINENENNIENPTNENVSSFSNTGGNIKTFFLFIMGCKINPKKI